MNTILDKYIGEFAAGRDLAPNDAEAFFDCLISEKSAEVLEDLLRLWNEKDVSEDELFLLASIMRKRCKPVASRHGRFVDIVGTGGSRSKTFNVSTAAAFVIAGAGVPAAKHGNRAATSNSGSADVLSELAVNAASGPAAAERCLNDIGICFMFAPDHHMLSPELAIARKKIGVPTVFNRLGPLCNPANAPHQVIGVWKKELIEKTANALARLGTAHSWVVHGSDGLDELTTGGVSFVCEIRGGRVDAFEVTPEEFGINSRPVDNVRCKTPSESAALIRSILDGTCSKQAAIDLVKINSAAGLYVAGAAKTLSEAFDLSTTSLESGAALRKLEQLAAASNYE